MLEEAAASPAEQPVSERGQVGAYYAAFMDEQRVEFLGATPLDRSLREIRTANSREELARLMGHADSSFHGSLFKLWIEPDSRRPERNAIYLGQGGLGSLDRDIYLAEDAAELRDAYRQYIARLLSLVRWENSEAMAAQVVEFEAQIAAASWTAADERDESKIYNPTDIAQLAGETPEFPWRSYLQGANLAWAGTLIVVDRSAIPALAALYSQTPLAVLKAWAALHLTDNAAPFLSHDFADAWFELHGRRLQGAQIQSPRWQRALVQVSGGGTKDLDDSRGAMGDAVGRLYTQRWFQARSRETLRVLVDDLKATLRATISASAWLSAGAKAEAIRKLAVYRVEIGAPEHGDEYRGLVIRRDDLFGDVERATAYAWRQDRNRLHHPTDRARWTMTPQTVNAYNYAPFSEVVFTAALLQPPAFDPTQDSALTYGGIGAIIGHELTHGFDDVGRRFDATGHMRDWWSTTDNAHFAGNAATLIAPDACRVNEDVRNVDGWYDAFGVTRESPMFIATDHRFRLW